MINSGFPLPSLRVLRERFQGINFNPGILDDVFTFLKVKVQSFTESERECFLIIDEMSMVEGNKNKSLSSGPRSQWQWNVLSSMSAKIVQKVFSVYYPFR